MRILFRYVFREFAIPLFYCTAGFLSIFVLFELFGSFGRIMEAGPAFSDIVRFFCGYIAPYFQWLMPAALLLATLYTMWNFCRHSEITAMRASGVGFAAIVRPVLVWAVICAAAVAWINEAFVPKHSKWAEDFRKAKFRIEAMEEKRNTFAPDLPGINRTWTARRVLSPDASDLEDVQIVEPGVFSVRADRARFLDGQWWLYGAKWTYFNAAGRQKPSPSPSLDALPLRVLAGFSETPRDLALTESDLNFLPVRDRFRYIQGRPSVPAPTRTRQIYDAWAKAAAPFACIIITLFAIPAGVATGRQSIFKGVLGAIAMFFAFFALTIVCMIGCAALAERGWAVPPPGNPACRTLRGMLETATPPVAAFLPAAIFFVAGLRLFRRNR